MNCQASLCGYRTGLGEFWAESGPILRGEIGSWRLVDGGTTNLRNVGDEGSVRFIRVLGGLFMIGIYSIYLVFLVLVGGGVGHRPIDMLDVVSTETYWKD